MPARDRTGGGAREVARCTAEACGVGWTRHPDDDPPAARSAGAEGVLGWVARRLARRRWRHVAGGDPSGALVVDVGAGAGVGAAAWCDLGARVVAVEPDPAEAARAARALRGRGVVHAAPLERWAPGAPSADIVVAWHVLEHLSDPREAVARMAGMLVPGGRLVVAVPNPDGVEARLLRGRWHGWEPARHRWHLSAAVLRAMLGQAGLRDVTVVARGGWAPALTLACSLVPSADPQRPGRAILGVALAGVLTPVAAALAAVGGGPQLIAVGRCPGGPRGARPR